ncbi:MAG: tRNA (adenosine(37)-N6)-threonylcarbamoyltransferase complex ATPase subunit type 1 TsaE [Deltaproteobacteria bacterium]|nr:tRNA (adenosine(37)-N6)-threonylcarbamoyltransferase complex ATPase subunit type 1 TsaE [Deltaproteobacteria bacterium]
MAEIKFNCRLQGSFLECVSHSPNETRALATKLAAWLAPWVILALNGELGSGKTEFVHGLAQGLGVPADMVASPSYTLAHEYPGRVLLVHLDLYRLEDLPADLLPDLEEYLSGDGVVAVEWARRLAPLLPGDYLEVQLVILNETSRQLTFVGHGARGRELVERLSGNQ